MMVKVSIITIGDELLIGQVVDTNSTWMAAQLNAWGYPVVRRTAVGDVKTDIINALQTEEKIADVILLTGGLGPTDDDITKDVLCEYFNGKIITNQELLSSLRYRYEHVFKRELSARNARQADIPDVCTIVPNDRGSAAGMLFEKEGKVYISMPGVPHEMMHMMTHHVIPFLKQRYPASPLLHRTLVLVGVAESTVADTLLEFERSLPAELRLAYLPDLNVLRLRLSYSGYQSHIIEDAFTELKKLVSEFVIADSDVPVQNVVAHILTSNAKNLAVSESCTGGYISHLLTAMPGASSFYQGGIVSYSNDAKQQLLGVDAGTIEKHGAVSEEVVVQMAQGIIKATQSDYAIAVSGIMGPGGEVDGKPVGTVWIAAGSAAAIKTKRFQLNHDRMLNIRATSVFALELLRKQLLNDGLATNDPAKDG